MSVSQSREPAACDVDAFGIASERVAAVRALPFRTLPTGAVPIRLPVGRIAVHDLRAGTSIVALEGALQLHFRDHSLAWLGEAVPATMIALQEGECFVMPLRGAVSIGVTGAQPAAFVLQSVRGKNRLYDSLRNASHNLIDLVKTLVQERAA